MPQAKLTPEIINAAIAGFEQKKKAIDDQIAELRESLNGSSNGAAAVETEGPVRRRKKFSAAARLRMKQAQQRRWATIKGESEPTPAAATKPKRKMSAAGRKAISEATKKRWALKRAATK